VLVPRSPVDVNSHVVDTLRQEQMAQERKPEVGLGSIRRVRPCSDVERPLLLGVRFLLLVEPTADLGLAPAPALKLGD
jgi:hypothetical protein